MQENLYPLESRDIDAIGKSRVGRSLPKNVKRWLYGGLAVAMVGFIYGAMGGLMWGSIGIVAVGAGAIWYSSMQKDKIAKRLIRHLKEEWREA